MGLAHDTSTTALMYTYNAAEFDIYHVYQPSERDCEFVNDLYL